MAFKIFKTESSWLLGHIHGVSILWNFTGSYLDHVRPFFVYFSFKGNNSFIVCKIKSILYVGDLHFYPVKLSYMVQFGAMLMQFTSRLVRYVKF